MIQAKKLELKSKIKTSVATDDNKTDSQDNQLLQSLLIQKKRKIALDPALFKRLLAEENEENKALLEGLRKKRNKKTGKMELFWDNKDGSNDSSSNDEEYSETDSEEYVNEDEKSTLFLCFFIIKL